MNFSHVCKINKPIEWKFAAKWQQQLTKTLPHIRMGNSLLSLITDRYMFNLIRPSLHLKNNEYVHTCANFTMWDSSLILLRKLCINNWLLKMSDLCTVFFCVTLFFPKWKTFWLHWRKKHEVNLARSRTNRKRCETASLSCGIYSFAFYCTKF